MDQEELSRLYLNFSPELLESLRRRFPWSPDIVDDAVQHAFLQLHVATELPREPRAWLRTVARHYIIDRLRAEGKLASDEETLARLPASGPPSASTTAATVSPTMVQRALEKLTTRARRMLRGKYQEGLTYGTLARREGVAKSSIGRILDRARQRLRRAVEELRGSR